MESNIRTMLKFALDNSVTDLFISTGKVPSCRSGTEVLPVEFAVFTKQEIDTFRRELAGDDGEKIYARTGGFDAPYAFDAENRFRLNFFETLNGPCLAARPIKLARSLDFGKLGLSEKLKVIMEAERGLILITGATGSGKSTTLSAMINYVNDTQRKHILTLEDPIEFLHTDKMSLVSQREVDSTGAGFAEALRNALRENPDIIMVGEMRDLETMQIAVTAAQTGHLVISTLHTSDAISTVRRLVNMCPEGQREQMIYSLSQVLNAVISQRLLPRADGSGLIPAQEILLATPTVRKQIEKNDIRGLEATLIAGESQGMQTFNTALYRMLKAEIITEEVAMQVSDNPAELKLKCQEMGGASDSEELNKSNSILANLSMRDIFIATVNSGASDFLLTVNVPPVLCINGEFRSLNMPPLYAEDVQRLIFSLITNDQRIRLEENRELDLAMTVRENNPDVLGGMKPINQRFRLNAFYQKGMLAMVGRRLADRIPTPQELMLPPVLSNLMTRKQGLILVTGPTGSGKSTTLAALVNELNQRARKHIITIEDPVEYVFENAGCYIEQRELGQDTKSFATGLRAALRQAPNVIYVGEMRDTETISVAITAADTGHLVLATLHSNDAAQTVNRIVDSFPAGQQNQVRQQFASSLAGIVAQRLIRKADGSGRVAAFEVMLGIPSVQALIREGKTHMLASVIETSGGLGMCTLQGSLEKLLAKGIITQEDFEANLPQVSNGIK